VIVLVGALSTIGMVWSGFGSVHAVFTAAELQTRLNQKLPRTVLNVTIEQTLPPRTLWLFCLCPPKSLFPGNGDSLDLRLVRGWA
jgi:hypothetical protein